MPVARARVGVPYSPSFRIRTAYFQENPMSKPPSPFPSAGFDATASLWAFHYRPEPPSLFHSRPSRPSNFPLVEITAAASLLHLQTRRPGRAEALAAPGRAPQWDGVDPSVIRAMGWEGGQSAQLIIVNA